MDEKIFDPAASVVCRRVKFVLITTQPGKEKQYGRRGWQTVPLKGKRGSQKGLCACRGLPSV